MFFEKFILDHVARDVLKNERDDIFYLEPLEAHNTEGGSIAKIPRIQFFPRITRERLCGFRRHLLRGGRRSRRCRGERGKHRHRVHYQPRLRRHNEHTRVHLEYPLHLGPSTEGTTLCLTFTPKQTGGAARKVIHQRRSFNLGFCILPSNIVLDTPFLSVCGPIWLTFVTHIWYPLPHS